MTYLKLGFAAGIALLIMGLVTAVAVYRGNAISAQADAAQAKASLKTALDVNADNEKTMTALTNERARSDKLAADLADEIEAANNTTLTMAKALADLRAENVEVDKFLRTPLPSDLRKMYSR